MILLKFIIGLKLISLFVLMLGIAGQLWLTTKGNKVRGRQQLSTVFMIMTYAPMVGLGVALALLIALPSLSKLFG